MLMSGYTLWTNSKGKTKKETGLKFPALDKDLRNSEMAENSRNSRKRGNNDLMEKMNEKLNLKPEMLNYVDSKDREIVLSLNEIKDFDFARSKDTRGITYEFKIPYHEAGNRVFTCDAKGDKPVVLGIECEAPEMPEKADRNAGMSGGRGSGDGMGRGGGRGGAGGSMGEKPSENGQSFKDYMFWVKLDMNSQE